MKCFFSASQVVLLILITSGCSKKPTQSMLSIDFNIDEAKEGLVSVEWTICADYDFLSYTLYRSSTPEFTDDPSASQVLAVYQDQNQCTFIDRGFGLGNTYYYAVKVSNSAGKSSWSNVTEIEVPASLLTFTTEGVCVVLEWTTSPFPSDCSYSLYRSYSPGVQSNYLDSDKLRVFNDSDVLIFSDSTSTHQTAYYSVMIKDEQDIVYWSNEVTIFFDFDRFIVSWGAQSPEFNVGQCSVPEINENFTAISGGYFHNLGLKEDGSIVAWGASDWDYNRGQTEVPEPNTDFIAISAGSFHSLGLKEDGSIIAWGASGWDADYGQTVVPDPNTDFIAVSAGWVHSLGLKDDGSVVAWGALGWEWNYGQTEVPDPNTDFIAVSAGMLHSLGLKADGSVVAWGNNEMGQCNVPSPNNSFRAISAGGAHSLGLKEDGSIVAWGSNTVGQCDVPYPNSGFVAVAGGTYHSLGLKADGSVVAWGAKTDETNMGQCDVPDVNTGFIGISAGAVHSIAIRAWVQ